MFRSLQHRLSVALFTFTALFLANGFCADAPAAKLAEPVAKGQRFFSTGHSFHFGFPAILDEISKSGGYTDSTIAGISSIGGSRAIQHVNSKPVNDALAAGQVDVLMMTPIYLPDPGIEKFAELGVKGNPNIRLTMMEFWLPFDNYEPRNYSRGPAGSPTEYIKPPATVDHNAATIEGLRKIHQRYFDEMDEHVRAVNKKMEKQVVFVVPAGQAVLTLREKIIAGKAPGLKVQRDLFTDNLGHPKPVLSVLMGYLHYAVIYRKNPVGLPAPKVLKVDDDVNALNQLLQEIAWDAAIHHPLSGVTLEAQGAK